jgi:hypothetical protein
MSEYISHSESGKLFRLSEVDPEFSVGSEEGVVKILGDLSRA